MKQAEAGRKPVFSRHFWPPPFVGVPEKSFFKRTHRETTISHRRAKVLLGTSQFGIKFSLDQLPIILKPFPLGDLGKANLIDQIYYSEEVFFSISSTRSFIQSSLGNCFFAV